jgi:hypothetical protein
MIIYPGSNHSLADKASLPEALFGLLFNVLVLVVAQVEYEVSVWTNSVLWMHGHFENSAADKVKL